MHTFHRRKNVVTFILCSAFFLFAYTATSYAQPDAVPNAVPDAVNEDPVLIAVGDIATCSSTKDSATATLVDTITGTIVTLGDNVYSNGTSTEFTNCYEPTWGRHKARTKPSPGNHDYNTPGAAGYYGYFGSAASPLDNNCTQDCKGYYSYDLGAWHIIALNSEIALKPGSEQEQWLRADLAAHPTVCTLAYLHKPRFSSGGAHGNNANMQPLWQALYDYGADVILGGHDHNYERFAPQKPTGEADPARGIREFVVGTGGTGLRAMGTIQPNSEVSDASTWGVLKLTLHATSYDWEFVPIAGQTFTDNGSANCVSNDTPTPEPTATQPTPEPTATEPTPEPTATEPTPEPTATEPAETGVYTFTAVADTYVQSDEPTNNFGNVRVLRVDASPFRYAYLRFNVEGISKPILSAKLYVYANSTSRSGYEVRGVSSNSWDETTLTYECMPARGEVIGASGAFSADNWTEVPVTVLVNGNGMVNFAMTGTSSTSMTFSSREGSQPPMLVVTTNASGQGDVVPLADPLNAANKKQLEPPEVASDGDAMPEIPECALLEAVNSELFLPMITEK